MALEQHQRRSQPRTGRRRRRASTNLASPTNAAFERERFRLTLAQGRDRGQARRPWRKPAFGVSISSIRAHRRSDFLRFDNWLAGKHIRSELKCLVELPIVEDTNCGILAQCLCDDRKSPGSVLPIRIFVASHEEASGLAGGALYFDMAFGPSLREDEIEPAIFLGNVAARETLCPIVLLDARSASFSTFFRCSGEPNPPSGSVGSAPGSGTVSSVGFSNRDRSELFQATP